jgi:hypothetical protein
MGEADWKETVKGKGRTRYDCNESCPMFAPAAASRPHIPCTAMFRSRAYLTTWVGEGIIRLPDYESKM